MNTKSKYLLRRKQDGWYISPGSKHTAIPDHAIALTRKEAREWLAIWGTGYEIVPLSGAKEVIG